MTNFRRIEEINHQCMRNIEVIMQDSKSIIKNFKVQQAEVMKNIMLNTEESASLEQQFRNFQQELTKREQDQYNQINGRIANEIDNMKHLILQEMSTAGVTSNNINVSSSPTYSTYSHPTSPMDNTNSMLDNTPNYNLNNQSQEFNNSILSDLEAFTNSNSQLGANQGLDSTMDLSSVTNGNMNNNLNNSNEIPVETKELDEWISEIKNLI